MVNIQNLSVEFSAKSLFDNVSYTINRRDKIALVGKNGAGKSTMLKIIAGLQHPTSGTVSVARDMTIGYLPQQMVISDDCTAIEEARKAFAHIDEMRRRLDNFNAELAERTDYESESYQELIEAMTSLSERVAMEESDSSEAEIEKTLMGLGFSRADFDRPTSEFSGGWRMRIELAKILLSRPDLLLLDEPTNHLDAESVLWLEHFLHTYPGAVLAVTHDRYFLDNVAEWICEVDRGQLFPYKGNYSTYLETKAARIAMQGQQQAKLAKRMEKELEWVRSSPKARQAKSKARLERYEQMVAEADRAKKLDFAEIQIPAGPRLGSKVLEAEHIHKEFDGRVLISDLSFSLPRNGIVGIIGPNGVGKTTLLKSIVGLEELSGGNLEVGETVKISYVDQNRAGIDAEKRVWEVVSGGTDYMLVGETEIPSRAYVAAFGFKGSDQQKPAGVLSGGERNRLNLALTLKQGGNLLLLDEPTNDLDVETLSSLESALEDFSGCVVVVSHDRMFLDRIATHILAWEGTEEDPGNWHWFEGNFEAYQADREARLGKEAAPRRLRRKLTRD